MHGAHGSWKDFFGGRELVDFNVSPFSKGLNLVLGAQVLRDSRDSPFFGVYLGGIPPPTMPVK